MQNAGMDCFLPPLFLSGTLHHSIDISSFPEYAFPFLFSMLSSQSFVGYPVVVLLAFVKSL
jgi:hypothetical protein